MATVNTLFSGGQGTSVPGGFIGSVYTAKPASPVSVAATGLYATIATISNPPAGIYSVTATCHLSLSGSITNWTYCGTNISLTSAAVDSTNDGGVFTFFPGSTTTATGSPQIFPVGTRIVTVNGSQSIYLVGRIDYSSTTAKWDTFSIIQAIRLA